MQNKLQDLHARSDKTMLFVIVFLFLFSLALSSWHDTWLLAFIVGGLATAIPVSLIVIMPGQFITRLSVAISFMVFSALHIQQAQGVTELHFGIFVLLAFLLYYRDWIVIVVAAGIIAVHHLLFNYLQGSGYPVYVFANGASLTMVFTHAAYVVFEAGLLIYMAIQGKKEAIQNVELQEISTHFKTINGMIDLSCRQPEAQSSFAINYNHFMHMVHEAIKSSQQAASDLSGTANQLNTLTQNTQQRILEQNKNTASVVSGINEMADMVQTIAQNSAEASSATKEADKLVENGETVVQKTMTVLDNLAGSVDESSEVIQRLESHTETIGTILEVIKGIADQTNLLALNAAIEAARAGEQGRGFAVVADEVRTLASRTQKSTEEIQEMIERLQEEAKNAVNVMTDGRKLAYEGVDQVSKTNEVFNSITQSVAFISKMNSEIFNAGEQQEIVINELQTIINDMAKASNETTNEANSLSKFCETLVNSAHQLQELVNRFTT
ncbi:methyl-accepting chemotaxis protein [methane-oxidizing endosymbiont of Gigantopelta aegis]|uniref:methyl-accepting chemotaxis protein n=1 Tax=methane-oxidizing endosymbiont of Gigantopelta aegis TaxID=2794938 RepID=UPI0018DEB47D|nr:methyl-accepting chemotaxis protein [methane-oxidizing endosymbiont of Gigantopelta aegis]